MLMWCRGDMMRLQISLDRYSNMERAFHSPLGRVGAYLGMGIWALVFACMVVYNYIALGFFALFMAGGVTYYFLVAQKREFFSQEEQDKFMKAYILNGECCPLCAVLCCAAV